VLARKRQIWVSGAGTFNALLPFYQEAGAAAHPTAAAAIMIEMGPTFFCCLIIAALFGAWTLFSRSLARSWPGLRLLGRGAR
jgi:hypothetical protein